jgi:two-component system CheB/CheR fusion protein
MISWSSGSTRIFGYESDEIIGKHFDIIFTVQNGIPQTEINCIIRR